ncbi:TrmB family transcriptional regulator [Haloarchaeobius sp. DFWS5]|uniref:TrmB family transcriptional regulator n=1 Tax=Haloarchaeobius sp. DFWS5 TaxID=3446114 RepID=UPI003EBE2BA6
MSTTSQTRTNRSTALTQIDSPQAKLVYLYLDTAGETTTATLQTELGLDKLSLYSILSTLDRRGLVERDGLDAVRVADAE